MRHRNAFPLLGTLATSVVGVTALAVSLVLNHPELLDAVAAAGSALQVHCMAPAFPL